MMAAMNILALDPASKTGVAHSDGTHDVWTLSDLGEKADDALRVWRLYKTLWPFVVEHETDLIVYEESTFTNNPRAHTWLHYKLVGAIVIVASQCSCGLLTVHPATVKKYATGNGRAEKPEMIQACIDTFGIEPEDDNEADALWILSWAQEDIRKPLRFSSIGRGIDDRPAE